MIVFRFFSRVIAVAPENPQFSVFGAARVNTPARQILVDDQNLAYSIGVSGLSVFPTGTAPRPAITAGNRGVVNSEDGTPNLRPGGFVTINGLRLANAATATSIPGPAAVQVRSLLRAEQSDPVVVTIRR